MSEHAPSPPSTPLSAGNVARFFNHSCAPNLIMQAVLRQGDSSMKYCLALFAAQ